MPLPPRHAGSVVARGLLQAASGVQLNGTRLDESLLSRLAAVVTGLASSTAQQAAGLAAAREEQAAAVANVTAAIAASQVRRRLRVARRERICLLLI